MPSSASDTPFSVVTVLMSCTNVSRTSVGTKCVCILMMNSSTPSPAAKRERRCGQLRLAGTHASIAIQLAVRNYCAVVIRNMDSEAAADAVLILGTFICAALSTDRAPPKYIHDSLDTIKARSGMRWRAVYKWLPLRNSRCGAERFTIYSSASLIILNILLLIYASLTTLGSVSTDGSNDC